MDKQICIHTLLQEELDKGSKCPAILVSQFFLRSRDYIIDLTEQQIAFN